MVQGVQMAHTRQKAWSPPLDETRAGGLTVELDRVPAGKRALQPQPLAPVVPCRRRPVQGQHRGPYNPILQLEPSPEEQHRLAPGQFRGGVGYDLSHKPAPFGEDGATNPAREVTDLFGRAEGAPGFGPVLSRASLQLQNQARGAGAGACIYDVAPAPQEPFDHEEKLFHFTRRGSVTEMPTTKLPESENEKVINSRYMGAASPPDYDACQELRQQEARYQQDLTTAHHEQGERSRVMYNVYREAAEGVGHRVLPEDGSDVAKLAQEFRKTGVAVRSERAPQLPRANMTGNRLW